MTPCLHSVDSDGGVSVRHRDGLEMVMNGVADAVVSVNLTGITTGSLRPSCLIDSRGPCQSVSKLNNNRRTGVFSGGHSKTDLGLGLAIVTDDIAQWGTGVEMFAEN